MALDVVRLRDSDMAAVPDAEGFRAAVLLWCASWHQLPAASLPNDDATLCRLAGYGRDLKTWKRAKEAGAMRGWIICSDGRLYHKVVAEKANEAWDRKQKQRERTEAARQAKLHRHRNNGSTPTGSATEAVTDHQTEHVTSSVTDNVTSLVTASKGQGQGKDRERLSLNPSQGEGLEREGGFRSRTDGTNLRATGENPRAVGANPRATGTNPRKLGPQATLSEMHRDWNLPSLADLDRMADEDNARAIAEAKAKERLQ